MDRRWQLVRDCVDCAQALFSKATLVRFRQARIAHDVDRRLIECILQIDALRAISPKVVEAARQNLVIGSL